MRGNQLENDLISLCPSNFESLEFYFSKFKSLVLQLEQCGIEKKDEKLVSPNYFVFVSTFRATKLTVRNWNMPKLAEFMEFLT